MASLTLVSQPEGIFPAQSDDPMCIVYTPVDAVADSCLVKYKVTLDSCEYTGTVPVVDVIRDPCSTTVDSNVYIDVKSFIRNFPGLGIRDEALETATYGVSDAIASNPNHYVTVSFEASICCSGIEEPAVSITDWEVVFSSISAEQGYTVNDYFYTLAELQAASVDPKVLAVEGGWETKIICLQAGTTTDSVFYSWVWLPIPEGANPADWTATMQATVPGMGNHVQTVTVPNAKRGVLSVDIGTVLAGISAFASGSSQTNTEVEISWSLTDNVTPVTYDLGTWVARWDGSCCGCSMFQFMNEFGVYDYMSLGRERGRNFKRTSTGYNICTNCSGANTRRRFTVARAETEHLMYTKPFKPTSANLDRMRSFFDSTEIYWPDKNKYVYLEPDLNVTIERSTGRIQVPVLVKEVSDRPLLINRR